MLILHILSCTFASPVHFIPTFSHSLKSLRPNQAICTIYFGSYSYELVNVKHNQYVIFLHQEPSISYPTMNQLQLLQRGEEKHFIFCGLIPIDFWLVSSKRLMIQPLLHLTILLTQKWPTIFITLVRNKSYNASNEALYRG